MTLPKKDENLFFSVFPSSLMMNCCDYIIIIINTYDMIIYTMIKNEIYCLLYFLFMPIPIWVTPLFITVFEISKENFDRFKLRCEDVLCDGVFVSSKVCKRNQYQL